MKTLLLAPELFTTDSGIPRMLRLYLKALCEIIDDTGEVRFIALNDADIAPAQLARYANNRLTAWHACRRSKLKFLWHTLWEGCRADIILCGHVAQLPAAWLVSLLSPKTQTILVAHGIEVWRPFSFWERRALKAATAIFCVSYFTRSELRRQTAGMDHKLLVLPNALDPYLEQAPVKPASTAPQPVILSVSRLSSADRYKGIDHLISAMPEILQTVPDAKLRIVGRGDDMPRLQQLANEHAVSRSVEFAGFVSDADLRREFAACTCFALPSLKEGFGLVYLEAMSAGKPCLAAKAGGAPEVVTPACGLLADYGDVPGIARACIALLSTKWDSAAIRACSDKFSYPRFSERLAAALVT